MEVKIKRLVPEAVIPQYAEPGDAGMDLTAVSRSFDKEGNVVYGTGLAFEIPEGYVGLIFPRSSVCTRDVILTNCVGVIDSGYRGEVSLKFKTSNRLVLGERPVAGRPSCPHLYQVGERIGQIIIIPHPHITFTEVEDLSDSVRGTNGYGHSGK